MLTARRAAGTLGKPGAEVTSMEELARSRDRVTPLPGENATVRLVRRRWAVPEASGVLNGASGG